LPTGLIEFPRRVAHVVGSDNRSAKTCGTSLRRFIATRSGVQPDLADHRVSTARDGSEALAIVYGARSVDVLITDYLMPVMTAASW
jgi:CheY-like chemotaxis protein